WEGWAILLRQKQKKLIMLPSETMIWQPEFTDKTLSRKPGAVHSQYVSLAYTERLKEAKLLASTGSTGDSYDNAMAESINGLYKA
ncbi:hypothetical protein MXM40_28775, partial [Escherichia coli]|nr:hypothetical protein [Escherichia coli]